MRREYDFSRGKRGKHAGKEIRIVGHNRSHNGVNAAVKIQQAIERDLKSREDFSDLWRALDPAEREDIRAAWLKKINNVLA